MAVTSLAWQRDPSIGDLADWQANYGSDVPASIAIPEPGTFTLAMFFLILTRRR